MIRSARNLGLARMALVVGVSLAGGPAGAHHPSEGLPWADALEHLLEWDHLAMAALAVAVIWLAARRWRARGKRKTA